MHRLVALIALVAWLPAGAARADEDAAWAALAKGGHVLLLRHATTDPGVGDPPGYKLDMCATQRNLSAAGREQARAVGERIKARGAAIGPVLGSRFCRCIDTATLAFGRVEPFPALDNIIHDRDAEPARTKAVRERVRTWRGPGTLVMVSHGVNISAIAGVSVGMGEGVVVDREMRIVGRIAAP